jgi:hypothetical protein
MYAMSNELRDGLLIDFYWLIDAIISLNKISFMKYLFNKNEYLFVFLYNKIFIKNK